MRTYIWTLVRKPRLYLPKPFSFFSSQCIWLSGSSGTNWWARGRYCGHRYRSYDL